MSEVLGYLFPECDVDVFVEPLTALTPRLRPVNGRILLVRSRWDHNPSSPNGRRRRARSSLWTSSYTSEKGRRPAFDTYRAVGNDCHQAPYCPPFLGAVLRPVENRVFVEHARQPWLGKKPVDPRPSLESVHPSGRHLYPAVWMEKQFV